MADWPGYMVDDACVERVDGETTAQLRRVPCRNYVS